MTPPLNVTLINDPSQFPLLQAFFDKTLADKKGILGWDIETTLVKDFYFRRCRTVQFGNTDEQYVVDLLGLCDNDPDLLFSCQGDYGKNLSPKLRAFMDLIRPVLCTRDFLKVGVNLGFEYQNFYWLFGLRTWNFYDCTMAEKCIWAGAAGLKRYAYFSMDGMMQRYFQIEIDKTLQTSFNLDAPLTWSQVEYAALDTRFPISLKAVQTIVADGKKLSQMGPNTRKYFEHLEPKVAGTNEPIILGDNLHEVIQIENNAIGFFEDMHIHGENLDKDKWKGRIVRKKEEKAKLISDVLDPIFIPLVGNKYAIASDDEIAAAETLWKGFNLVTPEEVVIKGDIRVAKKAGMLTMVSDLEQRAAVLEEKRKADKEIYKTACSDMKKMRTKVRNLAAKCEGEALINYGSDTQLLAVVTTMKGLKNVKGMDDEILEKYENDGFAVMGAIRKLHGLSKEVGTYGDQWATEWVTKPCKEEGWLNPGDGRLHCVYNQYDAETGRSSSEKPNGQNLPQDEEIRSSFVADPPNESIRVSNCCDADTLKSGGQADPMLEYYCSVCRKHCSFAETHAQEHVIITADMSGAELRIIAELADDPIWCGAFARDEDVHSVGTEVLHEENWVDKTIKSLLKPLGWTLKDAKEEVVQVIPAKRPGDKDKIIRPCAYYALKDNGEPARLKCDCPEHKELRNDNKSTNFLLAYGGGPHTLAKAIKKSVEKAKELMALHASKFPRIWAYLDMSGKNARMRKRSFDMFGRRRLFPDPTFARAKERVREDKEEELRIDPVEAANKLKLFEQYHGRKPDDAEEFTLTHSEPSDRDVSQMMARMAGTIERQGKNHAIQGTNATIIKLAGGCGYDKDGRPYLWHILPLLRAIVIKMVHDELVFQCPKHKASAVVVEVKSAFKRAAAVKMKKVVMESDANVAACWKK